MKAKDSYRHFGIITQVYPPDPAAVGQHLADIAGELGRRGCHVSVITSNRGYDDPKLKYETFERKSNVSVFRVPFCSFGKGSLALRLLGGVSLLSQASLFAFFNLGLTDLLLSTIPHASGALGVSMNLLRRLPFHYWLMDLNPDQVVALGKLKAGSPAVRIFESLNRFILSKARTITALDDEMAERFAQKAKTARRISVQPPWAIQDNEREGFEDDNAFRATLGFSDQRVIMHAGNHSAVHPLDTLVEAIRCSNERSLKFLFIGGGVGKVRIESWVREEEPRNVILLPYQPLRQVASMLRAADVHAVSVGNDTVGIVHPSKIYGALAAGRPVLVIGPRECAAARIVREFDVGWHVEHGDISRACEILQIIEKLPLEALNNLKARAAQISATYFSRTEGINRFCDRLLADS